MPESPSPFEEAPDAPPADGSAGESFGSYRLLEQLGEGGMGTVHRAVDLRLQRPVAIKQIRGDLLSTSEVRRRFVREAKALARLQHPHLCAVYEHGEVGSVPFLAMQFVRGRTLRQRIAAARNGEAPLLPAMPAPEAPPPWLPAGSVLQALLLFFEQAALALHHAHEHGLVHRDVKPGNLMVSEDGVPVVLDFGLVRDERTVDEASLTGSNQLLGTLFYMAPEQVLARAVDRCTDVYALGVCLYEALTFQLPFQGWSAHELQERILQGDPVPVRRRNRWVPRELEAVVATAMEIDPARRYRTAAGLAEDLRRVRERRPIQARRPGLLLRAQRWVQRNPVVATFLVLTTIGFGVASLLFAEAEAARRSSRANLDRFNLLSVVEWKKVAEAEAASLHPAIPAQVQPIESWLRDRVERLQPELARIQTAIAELDGGGQTGAPVFDRSETDFSAAAAAFLRAQLAILEPDLRRFLDGQDGTVHDVHRRLRWARTIREVSIDAHRAAWDAARSAVQTDPRYSGLQLREQIGLVPLGSDPDSGLLEFYDLWSAWDGESDPAALSIAARDPATGRLVLGPEHGIVFVLIPAGRFRMGAQKQAAQEPNFDPSAEVDEGPVREIALDPFLLAKHETTQAQWLRLAREANPSRFSPDHPDLKRIGKAGTLRHPVESVTWLECAEVARHAGFMLPTEAQWEYCARAGTATVFWFGDDPLGLRDRENVPDQTAKRHAPSFLEYFPWEDGFVVHGPVGSFQANPLGLHDMLGNVAEWCADWETGYEVQAAPGTGLREPPPGAPCAARIARGGAYYESHISFRSADRMEAKPDLRSERTGVRFARAIE